ncbi:C45 family autoproteolytic acyltransferase/hydolase [Streptomyces sp. NPDC001404]|uniref:C45 family autoproteolytic acyltransferase/hydolase n=1 Tax=Streptomyces sp. NPDC001404 TaxID=3364571 RepID=UPI003691D487
MARWDTGEGLRFFADHVWEAFGKLDAEFDEEIQGIADGAAARGVDVSKDVLVAWNGYNELLGGWWTTCHPDTNVKPVWARSGPHRCSAFVCTGEASADGKVVMAHNTWDRYAMGDNYNIVLDITPGSGHRMLMQAVPGYISSTMDWAVTDAGLMITESTIGGFDGFAAGLDPEFQRSRRAAQYSGSMREWYRTMCKDNNGGYANTWLLGETGTKRIARVDLGLKHQGYEEQSSGYFAGYNVAADLRVRNQECSNPGEYSDIRGNGARRVRWDQLFATHQGKVDVALAQQMIADHFDVCTEEPDSPSSRTICGQSTDRTDAGARRDPPLRWGSAGSASTTGQLIAMDRRPMPAARPRSESPDPRGPPSLR